MSKKNVTRLARCGIKRMRLIFKTEMLIYQSKADLDEKVLFGSIAHFIDPEIRKMLVQCILGNENSTFHSCP